MSAKEPLVYLFWPVAQRDQQEKQPGPRIRLSTRKVVVILLNGLLLLLVLSLLVFEHFWGQKRAMIAPPLTPIGDVALVDAPGFDTCIAPPVNLLQTWWESSPYRWLNVYLGGSSMYPTCGGKNLTPEWVRAVYQQGWSMLPTWVGPQAPCARQHAVMSADPTISYTQGQAEADAAIKAASNLGYSNTAPIYFDMEYFKASRANGTSDTACIQAVNAFLTGWNGELTTRGHLAGVYSSASNYPVFNNPNVVEPSVAWIAGGGLWTQNYTRACTVYGNKYISNTTWPEHPWIYQYTGGHNETYAQTTWNIDSDCANAPMVGHVATTPVVLQFQHA